MQTNFSKKQLENKDNLATEKIFKQCVHCGMCNATCPTHQLLGDELDGPRGRIYLIKDMLENNKKPTKNTDSSLAGWLATQVRNYKNKTCIMKTNDIFYSKWEEFINDSKYIDYFN